jgi:hypothetical protein
MGDAEQFREGTYFKEIPARLVELEQGRPTAVEGESEVYIYSLVTYKLDCKREIDSEIT